MNGTTARTITALKRWSCQDKQMPSIEDIKSIHVYDFDNTLFGSPLPNKQVWNGPTIGTLQAYESFTTGGWWHDSKILACTGKGMEEEEPRAWEGWWNESIVDLVRLSMEQKDAVHILLTGRKQTAFSEIISRMIKAKGLDFDMVCLKPEVGPANQRFSTTMAFKQELLRDLLFTYSDAEEIKVYEDRPKHTQGFRNYFNDINRLLQSGSSPEPRAPFAAEVIQVTEQATTLDPVTEVAEVQRMINAHNQSILTSAAPLGATPLTIKRTVFFTGYLLSPNDIERLSSLVNLPSNSPDQDLRYLANNILIIPRPCPAPILKKVGGMGHKVTWRITGLANLEDRLWAARVEPVNPSQQIHTENATPSIVIALRRNARPVDATRITSWTPVPSDQAFEFETTVGEKALLRIEEERAGEDEWESKFPRSKPFNDTAPPSRKRDREEDFPPLGSQRSNAAPRQQQYQNRGGFDDRRGGGRGGRDNRGRGGRGGFGNRGGRAGPRGGFGGRGGRGGGNRGQYRSLDDAGGGGGGASDGMQY